MTPDQASELAETFRLLGEPNRLLLVTECLDGPRSVTELTEAIGASQSLVSHHLRLLRAARLLRQRRDGKNVFYDLPDCHVATMLTNMMEHIDESDNETEGLIK
ncbi:ArsR family transcriptional regulator [Erythrobacter litoralis]|uniref:ArsR/SmtB family transcription factor n=1 Tax=Erythrobacter litoralis TaxID=39960 RepID=UPI0024354652|nr:metalloregulator ArsR/SmtB family transcription factor [Erythrobacter litoralis]MDG6077712.1 ArsR family transcriptional regulator [Erythrobacter litoralis]